MLLYLKENILSFKRLLGVIETSILPPPVLCIYKSTTCTSIGVSNILFCESHTASTFLLVLPKSFCFSEKDKNPRLHFSAGE